MKTVEEFKAYYKAYIKPEMAELEIQRVQAAKRRKIFFLITIPIGVLLILVTLSVFPIASIFIGFFYFIILTIIIHRITTDFKEDFKKKLISQVIYFFSTELSYAADRHISLNEYRESKLFSGGTDRFKGEDLIEGNIFFKENGEAQGVRLKMSELHTENRHTDGKGKTHYSTVFKGVFMILEFNKTFKSTTYVFQDSGILNKLSGRMGTKQVKLEDSVFEKEFEVYSSDQIEARYILSPDFMEKLLALKVKTRGKMRVAFKNNKMYLGISSNENILEPSFSKSLYDFNNILDYYLELAFYFDLIRSLQLDQKIYL